MPNEPTAETLPRRPETTNGNPVRTTGEIVSKVLGPSEATPGSLAVTAAEKILTAAANKLPDTAQGVPTVAGRIGKK